MSFIINCKYISHKDKIFLEYNKQKVEVTEDFKEYSLNINQRVKEKLTIQLANLTAKELEENKNNLYNYAYTKLTKQELDYAIITDEYKSDYFKNNKVYIVTQYTSPNQQDLRTLVITKTKTNTIKEITKTYNSTELDQSQIDNLNNYTDIYEISPNVYAVDHISLIDNLEEEVRNKKAEDNVESKLRAYLDKFKFKVSIQ